MSSLLVPLSHSVIRRVTLVWGAMLFALAAETVALQSRNASGVVETAAVDLAALNRHQRQVLSMPLRRIDHRGVGTPSIGKRFFRTDVLGVFGAAYLAEITIGTSTSGNPQTVDVLIDTGSFELWVDPNCTSSNVPEFCQAFGHYDPALSSTSRSVDGGDFSIRYGSGEASGTYYRDDIYISGARVAGQQFGVANSSDLVWFGIMGLGHGGNNGFTRYPLIVDSLTTQGLSTTRLFSLDLGRQISPGAAITGELVFGGVDTNRYAGLLQRVPTDPSDPVTLNSLAHRPPGATVATPFIDANLPVSVIVDSGTTLSLLPESVVSKVAAQFPGAQPDGSGGYRVDCAYQSRDGSVDFSFLAGTGTVTINVAYNDFIWNSGGDCFLGVWTSTDLGVWILGDTFLRGAYVTFDQTNNALFMSNYVSCGDGSNLVGVPAGPDAAANIPGACIVAATSPLATSSPPTSSPTFPAGTPASTVIPSAGSSLGPSLNPVGPPSLSTSPTPSSSPPPPPYRISSTAPALIGSPQLTPGAGDPAPNGVDLTAGADPKATPAMKRPDGMGAPVTTITATVTRGVVYAVTACPDSVTDCPLRGHVATRFETVVTTFCPGHDEMPSATTDAGGVVFVTESSAPGSTFVVEIGDTVSSGVEEEGGEQWVGEEQGEQQLDEEQEQEQEEEAQVVTTAYPSTKIYRVTSCAATDAACATGMTTTRVVTISKTVVVHPVPTPPAPAPAPENAFAPAWKGGANASATRNGTQWQGPAVISAAAVDDAQIDKRYLGAVFVVVWGIMVLL